MKLTSKKAFSLIELSIVILIIGLLVAGVVKGGQLYKKTQLATARNTTSNSPVNRTANLDLWLETTLESSFDANVGNGSSVTTWYNQNLRSFKKNNATKATTENQPIYRTDVFGSIPALDFDRANVHLDFNGSFLIGTDYTIFIVGSRRSNGRYDKFIGGTGTSSHEVLHFGFQSNNSINFSQYAYNLIYTPSPLLALNTPYIFNIMLNSKASPDSRFLWINGQKVTPDVGSDLGPAQLISYNGARIGRHSNIHQLDGNIAEIIMFSRALKESERVAIEEYLSKKYNIALE